MKKISLLWFEPCSVASFIEILKQSPAVSDEKCPHLDNFGLYMYLDKNLEGIVYLGQAFNKKLRKLRDRIRWEVTKDGVGCATSKFTENCQNFNIDRKSLFLKVAHIQEATENGKQIPKEDYELLNTIEMALIHEVSKQTNGQQPKINKRGKKRYSRESIEISNQGNYAPLPRTFKK